jgi:hypothetical protein
MTAVLIIMSSIGRKLWRPLLLIAFLYPGIASRAQAAVIASNCMFVTASDSASPSTSPIGCGCVNGSGSSADTGDWGAGSGFGGIVAKALPGTVCQMNVGNISSGFNKYKVDTCSALQGRAAEVAGSDCDVITVVELMSSYQCGQVCAPPGPNDDPSTILQNMLACQVCAGCQNPYATPPPPMGCKAEASVVCPSSQYDVFCSQAPPQSVGCDCVCVKKTQGTSCNPLPPSCQSQTLRADDLSWSDKNHQQHACSSGNYATCVRCTDPNGGPSTGNCVVHPDHCNDGNDEADRQACLNQCSTELLNRSAAAIAGSDVRTMSGDFNCVPRSQFDQCDGGWVSIASCPWLDGANGFAGMHVCAQNGATAAVGEGGLGGGLFGAGNPNCMLDFVLSTDCNCGQTQVVMNGINYGDHRTVIFGQPRPAVEYAGGGHRLTHGHTTVQQNGGTVTYPYSYEEWNQPLGFSCAANAGCGASSNQGLVVEAAGTCESRHQADVRAAVCDTTRTPKVLLCETASAWGWSSGQASGHGAETVDSTTAAASSSGNAWQAQCKTQRHVVDLLPTGAGDAVSAPFTVLSNANAACTLRPSAPPTHLPADPAMPD